MNIFSWFRMTFHYEAFEAYKATYDSTLKLLDFTPLATVVSAARPMNGFAPFDKPAAIVHAYRDLQMGDF